MPEIEVEKRLGRPKTKNYAKVCLGLDRDLMEEVKEYAKKYGWTQTYAIEYLLRLGLASEE